MVQSACVIASQSESMLDWWLLKEEIQEIAPMYHTDVFIYNHNISVEV